MKKSEYTEFILQNYEDARSDDDRLIYYHLRRFGFFDNPCFKTLQQISKMTISLYDLVRYRQKFQSKGKYLGTPEVMAKRFKNGIKRTEEERKEKLTAQIKEEPKKVVYRTWVDEQGVTHSMAL